MEKMRVLLSGICVLLISVAFFSPWVEVQSGAVGFFSKVVTGKRQATIDAVSGFDVPVMANGPDARFMIDVIQIFNPGIKGADKKSWLIWGVPLLAVLLWLLGFRWGTLKVFQASVGLLGVLIFALGVFYIAKTDLNKVVINVKISWGLWMTLVGYLAMGVLFLACLIERVGREGMK